MIRLRYFPLRTFSTVSIPKLDINGKAFDQDNYTNIRPKIIKLLKRKLYLMDEHPISFIKQRIVKYFYENFKGRTGNSLFSVYEQFDPIVTLHQNFDSLLVPKDHICRTKANCYYINKDIVLRSHMTAHMSDLIRAGLNSFLVVGDVYRPDEVDPHHYPAFHQLDGVRLFSAQELFVDEDNGRRELEIMRKGISQPRNDDCQESYMIEASKKVEENLKKTLEGLAKDVFGNDVQYRWTKAEFPFTHPSWELEILLGELWFEILGCGVIQHDILREAGCENRIGWAFGLGLDRWAMRLYNIPDIRILWSTDTGFLCQFAGKSCTDKITYKPVSIYPQCKMHISFWIPNIENYSSKCFNDLVFEKGRGFVEQVRLLDVFKDEKTKQTSHCYEIIYRHPNKTFVQKEVNEIHKVIMEELKLKLKVIIR